MVEGRLQKVVALLVLVVLRRAQSAAFFNSKHLTLKQFVSLLYLSPLSFNALFYHTFQFFEESTLLGQSHMIEAEAPRVSEFLTSQFASVEGFARFAVGEYIPPYLRPDQDTEVS